MGMNWNQLDPIGVARFCLLERDIPRLSKAGMPSRSEGWGGAEREPGRAKH